MVGRGMVECVSVLTPHRLVWHGYRGTSLVRTLTTLGP